MMKPKTLSIKWFGLAALLMILLTAACAPVRTGIAWADVSLTEDSRHIFVAYNNRIDLVDPSNGVRVPLRDSSGEVRRQNGEALNWQLEGEWQLDGQNVRSQFFVAPVYLGDDTLLVTDYNGYLLRVTYSAARIERQFIKTDGHVVADLTLAPDTILVPHSEQNLVALESENYDTRWTFPTERGVWSQPLVIEDRVYFTSMDHNFYAVDLETGQERWRLDLKGAVAATPLYDADNDRFFVGSFARQIFEVSLEGEILAEYQTEDWIWNTPVLRDGVLYVTDLSGFTYALNADAGLTEIWRTQATNAGIRPSPLVTEEFVVVAARNGAVVWLERETGTVAFSANVGSEILSDILLVEPSDTLEIPEPRVVVSTVSAGRLLVAFNLSDGVQLWTYSR